LLSNIVLPILFLLCVSSFSFGADFARGTIIDKVPTLDDKEQNYALYLPSNYSPDKKWPAVFVFDPDGDGAPPVEIFQPAAEKYGFIIIASNNSHNGIGPDAQTYIIKSLWKDTHARLAIDLRRTYAAGYSGGARVANNFAYSCKGCIAGVIACGASFPPEFPLGKDLPYAIFGTVGVDDFNYPEMIKLDAAMNKLGLPHHIARFNAEHVWLNSDLAFQALEWFNLQAMKNGALVKDPAFVDDVFQKREAEVDDLLKTGQKLEAYDNYASIVRIFAGLTDTSKDAGKLKQISADSDYKTAAKNEKELFDRELATKNDIVTRAHAFLDPETEPEAAKTIGAELAKIRETAGAKEDSGERRLARRILHAILAESNESGAFIYMQKKDYASAAANFELATLVRPANPYIELNLARALALDGRKKEALSAIGRAIEKGFKECSVLDTDKSFEALKTEKSFLKLRTQLGCN
jgi:hypothetical protein